MNEAPDKLEYIDKIPQIVILSKFSQVKAYINWLSSTHPEISKIKEKVNAITSDADKVEIIKKSLKWESNELSLKWTFDLSFVRWSTCQNSALMINNMNFFLDVPWAKTTEFKSKTPTVGSWYYDESAVAENTASQFTVWVAQIRNRWENEKKTTDWGWDTGSEPWLGWTIPWTTVPPATWWSTWTDVVTGME